MMRLLFCSIFIIASLLPICISDSTEDNQPLTTNNGLNRATENTRINTNSINQDELINRIIAEMENRGYIWKPWWSETGWSKSWKHPFFGGGGGGGVGPWGRRPPFGRSFWDNYQEEPPRPTSQSYNQRPSRIPSPPPKPSQPLWQSSNLSPQPAAATTINRQQLQSTATLNDPSYYRDQPATLQSTVPYNSQLYYQARPTQANRQSRPFTMDTTNVAPTNRRTDNLQLRSTNVASPNRRVDNNELMSLQRDPSIPSASFSNDQITELQQ